MHAPSPATMPPQTTAPTADPLRTVVTLPAVARCWRCRQILCVVKALPAAGDLEVSIYCKRCRAANVVTRQSLSAP